MSHTILLLSSTKVAEFNCRRLIGVCYFLNNAKYEIQIGFVNKSILEKYTLRLIVIK